MNIPSHIKATSRRLSRSGLILFVLVFTGTGVAMQALTHAATQNPAAAAKISFTFDDGLSSAITSAAPILQKHGLTATDYVITGCVGMTKAPNDCHANTDTTYMSWDQINTLRSTYGWEIGSHTATHPYLATKDASDGQDNVLTPDQVKQELVDSKAALAAHGIDATDMSTPYGDYNNAVLAQIAQQYASQRGFADEGANDWPNNDYLLYDYRVQAGVSVSQVENRIDQAIANHQWLILTMHNIKDKPSSNPDDYEYSSAMLDQIAAYVQAKQTANLIQSVHVNDGLVKSDTNLLPNGTFNDGISDGWTTDSPATIKQDAATNGSYPDPTNSVAFTSSTASTHLFSPKVSVSSNTSYMLKAFLNVKSHKSGVVGFYIDEYDANGNWISGQYRKDENSSFVEDMNFDYTPTSINVSKASLQVIIDGTGISGYLDNAEWFPLESNSVIRPSFLPNSNFDQGMTEGWTTDDPTHITADDNGHGSPNNTQNSIKLQSGSDEANGHLFSTKLGLTPGANYTLTSYLDIQTIKSGEVAFYIDEYDRAGNWISGQYKVGVHTQGAGYVSFNYKPSSPDVDAASLQVIVVGNSDIVAYFDDAGWYTAN